MPDVFFCWGQFVRSWDGGVGLNRDQNIQLFQRWLKNVSNYDLDRFMRICIVNLFGEFLFGTEVADKSICGTLFSGTA